MDYTVTGLFLAGLGLGASRCMFTCGPVLGLYVAGSGKEWRGGLRATLIFSLARLSTYPMLGLLAGFSGALVRDILSSSTFSVHVWVLTGLAMSLLGAAIVLGKEPHLTVCRWLNRYAIDDSAKTMALLGFVLGLAPCAPLLAVLTHIAATAQGPLQGALYGFCFGLGPALITPVVMVGIMASVVPRLLFQTSAIRWIFQQACGLLLLVYGLRLIARVW